MYVKLLIGREALSVEKELGEKLWGFRKDKKIDQTVFRKTIM